MIWEVDEDCDKCVNWEEFKTMCVGPLACGRRSRMLERARAQVLSRAARQVWLGAAKAIQRGGVHDARQGAAHAAHRAPHHADPRTHLPHGRAWLARLLRPARTRAPPAPHTM